MDEDKVIRPMDFVRLTNIDESNVIKDTKNHIGLVKEVSRDGRMSIIMNTLQIIIVIYSLRIYAVNYCSDISTTILCHILSRASISPRQVNILMGNTNTGTSIVG